jgi:hypothetical protein
MDLFFLLLLLAAAGPILVAPSGWARAVTGWVLLGIGLLVIELKSATASPFDDDGVGFEFGMLFVLWWTLSVLPALLIRHRALLQGPGDEGRSVGMRWLRDWAVPLGLLFAAVFLHWLGNRIAGASPAWLVHVLLGATACGCAAGVVWRCGWRFVALSPASRLAFAVPAAIAVLVVYNASAGFGMWSRARQFAGGAPWCAMTYGGFQHERGARSGWDLSPLVNRRYGSWAVGKAGFLVVGVGADAVSYRWFQSRFQQAGRIEPGCVPEGTPA